MADITATVAAALAADGYYIIPPGNHTITDLDPPTGSTIICQSRNCVISATTTNDDIISTTAFRKDITIVGGKWGDAASFWRHDSSSSLASCVFEDVYIEGMTVGWDISSAVGCVWSRCKVALDAADGAVGSAWRLGATDNACNMNTWRDCRVAKATAYALILDDTDQPKRGNLIDNCWFEDLDSGAIYAGEGVEHLVIRGGYFETNGDDAEPDINLVMTAIEGSTIPRAIIDGVAFAVPVTAQTERILIASPQALVSVRNCSARLKANDVFVSGGGNLLTENNLEIDATVAGTLVLRRAGAEGSITATWES